MCNEFESKQELNKKYENRICGCGCIGLEEKDLKTELLDEKYLQNQNE